METIGELESMVQGELQPDLTLILDLDPEIGMQRAGNRGELDRFEREQMSFFRHVRQGYLDIAQAEPERCKVIDAAKALEDVKLDLLAALEQGLSKITYSKN